MGEVGVPGAPWLFFWRRLPFLATAVKATSA
jgi:hypothetical protein